MAAGSAVLGLVLFLAQAAAAETALETCEAEQVHSHVLSLCLEGLAADVEAELERVHDQAADYFEGLDAITGNARASRTLAQAQLAFELFRELDCHLTEIDQGIGNAAADLGLACRIDHDRARIASLLSLIGNAAAAEAEPTGTLRDQLLGTAWRVIEIAGEPAMAFIETTLEIDENGEIAGIGGCNRYFGTAEIDALGGIALGEIGATRMACDEPIMARETSYFAVLQQVAGFRFAADVLELTGGDDVVLVRLERDPA